MELETIEIVKAGYSKFAVAMMHAVAPKLRAHLDFLKRVPVYADPLKSQDAQSRKRWLAVGLHYRTGYKK